jgi:hypothetical protein
MHLSEVAPTGSVLKKVLILCKDADPDIPILK